MGLLEIREAIAVEHEEQSTTFIFKVARARRIGSRLASISITTNDDRRNSDVLSESLEGANAWWALGPNQHGEARVLSVFPDDNELHLTAIKGELPDEGTRLRVYPPDFIKAVRTIYSDSSPYATTGLEIFRKLRSGTVADSAAKSLPNPTALTLREKQKDALRLPYQSHALLIGPPGTGKTYTLAAVVAQHLISHPKHRVLLLSNSNAAVDDALVKVDRALEKLSDSKRKGRAVRIGSNFVVSHYEGREHLLPSDKELTAKLKELDKKKPDQKDAVSYDQWLTEYTNLRQKADEHTRELIRTRQLVATTASSASFRFEQLIKSNFDWLVFDEASQVPLYQTIALLPLGGRYLFCGDGRQLPPVCVANKNTQAQKWVAKSIFDKQGKFPQEAIVELNEQNRMATEICSLVSQKFYSGKLITAQPSEEKELQAWLMERKLESKEFCQPIEIVFVEEKSRWRKRFMGDVRTASAAKAVEIYQALEEERNTLGADIMILAPLHSQLRQIRQIAKQKGFNRIPCSTIHKAQGREYHTVVLDVINLSGENRFLSDTLSKELINVAFSRAKARLIILAHESDLISPYINAAYLSSQADIISSPYKAEDISNYLPVNLENIHEIVGKKLRLNSNGGAETILEPTGISGGWLMAIKHPGNEETKFKLSFINAKT